MQNFDIFKRSCIVYLQLPEKSVKQTLNNVEFKNLDKFLEKNTDISIYIDRKSTVKVIEKIEQKLGEIIWI